ncbi:hypothetical protein EXN66_Car004839 [Channa argus]|uniref:Uncharacterized protein n=1 Tax=Channa argus TaxID=215402 RepID=A0A6G1PFZ9_CHAAH|nr:hypothetical protein EXN66_Car004839 [Channa argus]
MLVLAVLVVQMWLETNTKDIPYEEALTDLLTSTQKSTILHISLRQPVWREDNRH